MAKPKYKGYSAESKERYYVRVELIKSNSPDSSVLDVPEFSTMLTGFVAAFDKFDQAENCYGLLDRLTGNPG